MAYQSVGRWGWEFPEEPERAEANVEGAISNVKEAPIYVWKKTEAKSEKGGLTDKKKQRAEC